MKCACCSGFLRAPQVLRDCEAPGGGREEHLQAQEGDQGESVHRLYCFSIVRTVRCCAKCQASCAYLVIDRTHLLMFPDRACTIHMFNDGCAVSKNNNWRGLCNCLKKKTAEHITRKQPLRNLVSKERLYCEPSVAMTNPVSMTYQHLFF